MYNVCLFVFSIVYVCIVRFCEVTRAVTCPSLTSKNLAFEKYIFVHQFFCPVNLFGQDFCFSLFNYC